MFRIIINCGPCEDVIRKCLRSVKIQTVKDWKAYVTVDAPSDRTFLRAILSSLGDSRIYVKLNHTRVYSLANQICSIELNADPEDIIVSLDGDDWFSNENSLAIIKDTYDRYNCWVTYGSWVSVGGPAGTGLWPAYPDGLKDFRHYRWLGTAVRTWKKWLWDRIKYEDLQDNCGKWFCVAEDQAIMFPLLEMSGTNRARHISEPLMVYNQSVISNPQMEEEAKRVIKILQSRSRYPELNPNDPQKPHPW